jgi:hypothetical protein
MVMKLQSLIESGRRALNQKTEAIEGAPADVNRYYKDCRKSSPEKGKEYCARVAWQIYCQNNPGYEGCTEAGKTSALSGPISQSAARPRANVQERKKKDCGCGG